MFDVCEHEQISNTTILMQYQEYVRVLIKQTLPVKLNGSSITQIFKVSNSKSYVCRKWIKFWAVLSNENLPEGGGVYLYLINFQKGWGGGWGVLLRKLPRKMENPGEWGGGEPVWNSLCGGGMDIFWTHTIFDNAF